MLLDVTSIGQTENEELRFLVLFLLTVCQQHCKKVDYMLCWMLSINSDAVDYMVGVILAAIEYYKIVQNIYDSVR